MAAERVTIGTVLGIYYCPTDGGDPRTEVRHPMQQVGDIVAEANRGLVYRGTKDRYHAEVLRGFWSKKRPAVRQISLISDQGLQSIGFPWEASRRNLIVDMEPEELLRLIGVVFGIGQLVEAKGSEDCTPCNRPSKLSGIPGFEKATGLGGLRSGIVTGGEITVGDVLWVNQSRV